MNINKQLNQAGEIMSKKLTAKDLLKEVQSIKKQASKEWLEDYVFQYTDKEDLLDQLDTWSAQHVNQHYIEDVSIKGDTAYVTYTRTQPIRVQKACTDWWLRDSECYPQGVTAIKNTYDRMIKYMKSWAKKTDLPWKVGIQKEGHVEMFLSDASVFFQYDIAVFSGANNQYAYRSPNIDEWDRLPMLTQDIDESMDKSFRHFKSLFDKNAPKILKDYLANG